MASAFPKLTADYSETAFGDNDKTLLLEGEENSSTVEVATSDNDTEVLPESSPVKIPTSFAVAALMREGARFTITPVLAELMRTLNRRVFPVFSRSASYGGTFQEKITNLSTPSALDIHEREPLVENEEIENDNQYIASDKPTTVELPSPQNRDENQPEQRRSFMQRYTACSISVANSWYIVPFLLQLFGFSCFTFYVGIAYFHRCEFLEHLPIIFALMGAAGTVGILSRIVYILTKKRWFARFEKCRSVTFGSIMAFLLGYFFETFYFYFRKGYPTTGKGPRYCHPSFYNYVYGYNWAVLAIVIIMIIVHGPNSLQMIRVSA